MADIKELLSERILFLDGAMGTMLQRHKLEEADYRGEEFAGFDKKDAKGRPINLKGNHDMLTLTRPDIIEGVHRAYLEAGADIIETNTFNSTRTSQADYATEELAYRLNLEAARLARRVADEFCKKTPDKPRFVAGVLGPTNKTLSLSPNVQDPAFRALDFETLEEDYHNSICGLIDGGADIILVETIFDTLNAKAALSALMRYREESGKDVPVMLSATITDAAGRLLAGQTAEAFLFSVLHAEPVSVGFNCAFGPDMMRPHLMSITPHAPCAVSVHPNAGLPNAMGEYDQGPEIMAKTLAMYAREGLLNIVGGCCGTTPEHIKAIVDALSDINPRRIPDKKHETVFTGLEVLRVSRESLFVNVGERTNVAGSARFKKCIANSDWDTALEIARAQVEAGAQIIDINVDDPLIDAPSAMKHFLNLIASEPEISRVPIMLDSSNWKVIEAGLMCLQGKGIVNSISLKDGEEEFIRKARFVKRMGAAVLVMCFDENGQADSLERRMEIAERSYRLLTTKAGIAPEDIVIDANIFAIGTGMAEHANYGVDFLEAVKWIKENLPYAKTSGGVSNISFSFRGNNPLRDAMHSVFLYHAVKAGLDMGIVNPARMLPYEEVPENVRKLIEDLLFNRNPEATELLLEAAEGLSGASSSGGDANKWRELDVEERLTYALLKGISSHLEEDLPEAHKRLGSALAVIEGPLMKGMNEVGRLFGEGKMFLPQVVKTARVMKNAVDFLTPLIKKENAKTGGQHKASMVIATVKGDVHDIGKNIVKVVLECNNYRVIDLGVMVPMQDILETADKEGADVIGLSGLITPSLEEMRIVAEEMERRGKKLPLMVGGAATSPTHTALKIAPEYSGPVIHSTDASDAVKVMSALSSDKKESFIAENREKQKKIREQKLGQIKNFNYISLSEARKKRFIPNWKDYKPVEPVIKGAQTVRLSVKEVRPYIDWRFFYIAWEMPGKFPDILSDAEKGEEAKKLYDDANRMLDIMEENIRIDAAVAFYPACSTENDDILLYDWETDKEFYRIPMLRQQREKKKTPYYLSLSDFLPQEKSGMRDYMGFFVTGAGRDLESFIKEHTDADQYSDILVNILGDRLAEAAAEALHQLVRKKLWGYAPDEKLSPQETLAESYQGIRPAPGYPPCPDHTLKADIWKITDAQKRTGIRLTESYMMMPSSSVSGFYFAHPDSHYFAVGRITEEQLADYATRRNMSTTEAEKWLRSILPES
ncbi:methionine synthase [Spirochaetia bacterium 38H-sp]|uniref:Methionine synthase n=1 Tax=Rarispira pelagica TaxID=3141764 RepID=A0ABU9UB90_9SPIR